MTALGNSKRTRQGREAHAQVVTRGLCGNVIVESSTLDMYAKCGMMVDARKVFDRMKVRNAVSWCALFGGIVRVGSMRRFSHCFDRCIWRTMTGIALELFCGLALVCLQ
jgi:pentatricopeptide repeat protein